MFEWVAFNMRTPSAKYAAVLNTTVQVIKFLELVGVGLGIAPTVQLVVVPVVPGVEGGEGVRILT